MVTTHRDSLLANQRTQGNPLIASMIHGNKPGPLPTHTEYSRWQATASVVAEPALWSGPIPLSGLLVESPLFGLRASPSIVTGKTPCDYSW